jgi:hypothetical protein
MNMLHNIQSGTKVRVYFNLHKKCLSVQTKVGKSWKVSSHQESINLMDVSFKVSEAGRQRVIAKKRKNVHAFIVGTLVHDLPPTENPVTYNPYRAGHFYTFHDGAPVHQAQRCVVEGKRVFIP